MKHANNLFSFRQQFSVRLYSVHVDISKCHPNGTIIQYQEIKRMRSIGRLKVSVLCLTCETVLAIATSNKQRRRIFLSVLLYKKNFSSRRRIRHIVLAATLQTHLDRLKICFSLVSHSIYIASKWHLKFLHVFIDLKPTGTN